MRLHLSCIFLSLLLCGICAFGQSHEAPDSVVNIVAAINGAGENITVSQSNDLYKITSHAGSGDAVSSSQSQRGLGYRIQVFSDNNARTAKANAEYRKHLIESQMEGLRGYLTYESPYWRVRIGDFRTQAEASTVMRQLKSMFPAFANDLRLVRERINPAQ